MHHLKRSALRHSLIIAGQVMLSAAAGLLFARVLIANLDEALPAIRASEIAGQTPGGEHAATVLPTPLIIP